MTLRSGFGALARASATSPANPGETRPVSALEALAAHRELTLLGKPGGGKSTFGAHCLLALAQAWQGHDASWTVSARPGATAPCSPSGSSCAASPSSFPPMTGPRGPATSGTSSAVT
jgi:hypothetical protein